MNIRSLSFAMLTIFAVLTSCNNSSEKHATSTAANEGTPVKVTTRQVDPQQNGTTTVLSGTIQSKNKATVSARMMGYVSAIKSDVGDQVTAGQTILTIENNELPAKRAQVQAGITEAEAALNNTKINYERMKILWEKASITRKEWDDISAQYEMMKAKTEVAKQMHNEIDAIIALTTVKAPISGVVTAKNINMGDLVNPGVPLMSIEGNEGYEVVTYVSDHQIGGLTLGKVLDCHINALDKSVKATVTEISPSAVNTGGQFAIKAALELSSEEMKMVFPGMYANVHTDIPGNQNQAQSITVEKTALIKRGQLTGIFTISTQNTALLRWVRIGKDYGDRVEIVSGLQPGEAYVVGDLSNLVDGTPVTK